MPDNTRIPRAPAAQVEPAEKAWALKCAQAGGSPVPLRVLRKREVCVRSGLSIATIYRLMGEGRFPKPVSLSGRLAVGWLSTEVDAWLAERVAERDARSEGRP